MPTVAYTHHCKVAYLLVSIVRVLAEAQDNRRLSNRLVAQKYDFVFQVVLGTHISNYQIIHTTNEEDRPTLRCQCQTQAETRFESVGAVKSRLAQLRSI